MSEGPRIHLERADKLAAYLFQKWTLDSGVHVVGSVRRRKDLVGDLELLAPARPKDNDPLCRTIAATMVPPAGNLFSEASGQYIGRALKGLKPGFLMASLVVRLQDGVEIPVQINRYSPENLGWMLIRCTGPREFGMYFLGEWKKRFEIPLGDEKHQASIDDHLVDAGRRRVPVPTEEDAFRLAGLKFVPPHVRDQVMEQRARAFSGAHP